MVNLITFIKSFFKSNNYISPLDQFLKNYDKAHPRQSQSQRYEVQKYKRVYQLRDNKITMPQNTTLWDKF